jgi:deazaflavin-dependent oxidoreductase (nitroreductase family)
MAVEITPNGTRGGQMPRLPKGLYNAFSGLYAWTMRLRGWNTLTLVTVGGKTGRTHEVELRWFEDGDDVLIVASAGGAARHPAWYYNLARNPDKVWIVANGRKIKVTAESLKGDERRRKYDEIATIAPGFATYETKTDREIPVIRLKLAPMPAPVIRVHHAASGR